MYPIYTGLSFAEKIDEPNVVGKKLNASGRAAVATIFGDTVLSTGSVALGVLGLLGIIPGVPAIASYSLIGVSGVISIGWLSLLPVNKAEPIKYAYYLTKASVSKDPKLP